MQSSVLADSLFKLGLCLSWQDQTLPKFMPGLPLLQQLDLSTEARDYAELLCLTTQ